MNKTLIFRPISVLAILVMLIVVNGCVISPRARATYDARHYQENRLKRLETSVETVTNVFDMQFVADFTQDPTIKQSADDRVLQLIRRSNNLRDVLFLSAHAPLSTHAEDARLRGEMLLGNCRDQGAAGVSSLLSAIYLPSQYNSPPRTPTGTKLARDYAQANYQTLRNVLQAPLEASIIATAREVITNNFDQIAEDDYSHDLSFPGETLPLPELVSKIKTNYRHSAFESVDILYSIVGGQGQLTVTPEARYNQPIATTLQNYTGFTKDTFKTTGVAYERWRYGTSGIVREFIRRESENTSIKRAVATEIITWDGIHYRKSSIEGL